MKNRTEAGEFISKLLSISLQQMIDLKNEFENNNILYKTKQISLISSKISDLVNQYENYKEEIISSKKYKSILIFNNIQKNLLRIRELDNVSNIFDYIFKIQRDINLAVELVKKE